MTIFVKKIVRAGKPPVVMKTLWKNLEEVEDWAGQNRTYRSGLTKRRLYVDDYPIEGEKTKRQTLEYWEETE